MKRLLVIFLVFVIFFTLSACFDNGGSSKHSTTSRSTTATTATATATTTATVVTTATTAVTTTTTNNPQSTEPLQSDSYIIKIARDDFPIYNGPGYEYNRIATVELAGLYTIVDEGVDTMGNLWGKLKSGIGWVDLTLIEEEKTNPPTITVSEPHESTLESGNYHYCIADDSDYTVRMEFHAYKTLTNVSFYHIDVGENYSDGDQLYYIAEWNPTMPFVADVSFPGDMSTFGISFTDKNGDFHRFAVSTAGIDTVPPFCLTAY